MTCVYINNTAAFLPHEAVGNDEIEAVLGIVGDRPSRARRLVLRSNGIKSRYYAIDRRTGKASMSNAQLTARAIHALHVKDKVDVLVTGTSSPDQIFPNHGVMVHGELGWRDLEVASTSGVCLSGTTALKYAYLAVKAGDAQRAISTGSERASAQMAARQFRAEAEHRVQMLEQLPEVAFEKDFLRWMLSDGAGAFLLENTPRGPLSLRIRWIELFSYANEMPTCMYSGCDKNEDGTIKGWADYESSEWLERSVFAVKQDVRLLNENIVQLTLGRPLLALQAKYGIKGTDIDWFLPHLSSMYFAEPAARQLDEVGFHIEAQKWFTNLTTCGNTGSASPYIMLDELFHSGRISKGQTILLFVPESGRFSSGFVCLDAV